MPIDPAGRPGFMKIDPAGYPFIAFAGAPAILLFALGAPAAAVLFLFLAAAVTLFFRDPERRVPDDPSAVVSPADGRVVVAGPPQPGAAPPGDWQQVSIFLSPLDVHVNRLPVGGLVTRVDYQPGKYLPAYRPEAATENERNELWIDCAGTPIVCRQITGVLVRRVVCRVRPGDRVRAGQRFGVMKFGSRVDLFLPPSARLLVGAGARARAGESILARLT
jgi:phosphatidylserine decarboxylase